MTDDNNNFSEKFRPITGIDHALIGVSDLEIARISYERLGFTVTPRGRHIGWGTENHTVMFENDYVELIGVADPTKQIHNLDKFLINGDGLLNVVLGTRDADETSRWLKQQSSHAEEAKDLQRLIKIGDHEEILDFRYVSLPPNYLRVWRHLQVNI